MITVAVGIVLKGNRVFMGRRQSVDEHSPGLWEFPGGKVEDNETIEAALVREFSEELGVEVKVGNHFLSLKWSYLKRDVQLEFYFVHFVDERAGLHLHAHDEHRWIGENEFQSLDVLPANRVVLEKLREYFLSLSS